MSKKISLEDKLILLCPECRNDIPFTKIIFENKRIVLNMKCICSKEVLVFDLYQYLAKIKEIQKVGIYKCSESRHHIAAQKFCEICQRWLCIECLTVHQQNYSSHILRNQELNLSCCKHKASFNWYCHDCNQGFCKECDKDHNDHNREELNQFSSSHFLNELVNLNKIFQKNQQYKNNFNQLVDKTIDTFIQWKEEVNIAFDTNEKINKTLEDFCILLHSTCEIITNYPHYPLNQTLKSFTINSSNDLTIDSNNIEDHYNTLMKHFSSEYLLKPQINSPIINNEITNKIEETHNINDNDKESSEIQTNQLNFPNEKHNNLQYKIMTKQTSTPLFKSLHKIEGHTGYVNKVIQLSKGQLVSCSNDSTIKIWNISSFECISTIKGHISHVYSIIQLEDERIVSCGWDKSIKFWDSSNYSCLKTFKGHTAPVNSLIELKDKRLVSCSVDRTIKFWNSISYKINEKIEGHSSSVNALLQLENTQLVSGGSDFMIKIWDINTYKCLFKIIAHSEPVRLLSQFNNDNNTILVSSGWDKVIKLWDFPTLKNIDTISSTGDTRYLLTELDDERFVSCDSDYATVSDYSIEIWELNNE